MTDTPDSDGPPPIVQAPTTGEEGETDDWELWDAQDQTKKLAARFANRLYVSPEGQNIRVVFGERIKDESLFHTALVIPVGDALEMAHLLMKLASAAADLQLRNLREYVAQMESLQGNSGLPSNG